MNFLNNKIKYLLEILIFIAILIGHNSMERFISINSGFHFPFIRDILMLLIVVILIYIGKLNVLLGSRNYFLFFSVVFIFLIFVAVFTDSTNFKFLNYLYIIFFSCLSFSFLSDDRSVRSISTLFCVLGIVLLLYVFFTGNSNSELNGPGLASIGSPLTTGRLLFIAAAGTLLLSTVIPARHWWLQLAAACLTSLFIYCCLATLQKGIVGGVMLIMPIMIISYFLTGNYRTAVLTLGSVLIAFLVWHSQNQSSFNGRVAAAGSLQDDSDPKYYFTGLGDVVVKARYCYLEPFALDQVRDVCTEAQFTERTGRLALAMRAVKGISAHPILGNGFDSFRLILRNRYNKLPEEYKYPHNFVLESIYETGVVGFGFWAFAAFWLVIQAIRAPLNTAFKIPLFAIVGHIGLTMLVSGDIYDSRLFWIILCMMAGYNSSPSSEQMGKENNV